jgi:hypothetical protein
MQSNTKNEAKLTLRYPQEVKDAFKKIAKKRGFLRIPHWYRLWSGL